MRRMVIVSHDVLMHVHDEILCIYVEYKIMCFSQYFIVGSFVVVDDV